MPDSYSQLGQDKWVLSLFPQPGFFVDVGFYDGVALSNTYLLELNGWKGIGIDPFPNNYECRKNTIIAPYAVYSEDNKKVSFCRNAGLSGITTFLGKKQKRAIKKDNTVTIKSRLLVDILKENNAPEFIEYLSLDTEGTEYEILRTFDWDSYRFGCLTIEHNRDEAKKKSIAKLLESKGYKCAKYVKWDVWYVHESVMG